MGLVIIDWPDPVLGYCPMANTVGRGKCLPPQYLAQEAGVQ